MLILLIDNACIRWNCALIMVMVARSHDIPPKNRQSRYLNMVRSCDEFINEFVDVLLCSTFSHRYMQSIIPAKHKLGSWYSHLVAILLSQRHRANATTAIRKLKKLNPGRPRRRWSGDETDGGLARYNVKSTATHQKLQPNDSAPRFA